MLCVAWLVQCGRQAIIPLRLKTDHVTLPHLCGTQVHSLTKFNSRFLFSEFALDWAKTYLSHQIGTQFEAHRSLYLEACYQWFWRSVRGFDVMKVMWGLWYFTLHLLMSDFLSVCWCFFLFISSTTIKSRHLINAWMMDMELPINVWNSFDFISNGGSNWIPMESIR